MRTQQKKANITLYVLISIVLSIMLLTSAIGAIKKITRKEPNNSKELAKFAETINNLLQKQTVTSQKIFLQLNIHELFLFYSTGNKDITLTSTYDGVTRNLIFKRPKDSACTGSACVCYCSQNPLWSKITTKPYIKISNQFNKSESSSEKNYTYNCTKPLCEAINNKATIFWNERGKDVFDAIRKTNLEFYNGNDKDLHNDKYFPIPLDIPSLLIMENIIENHNIFFSHAPGHDYNRYEQDDYLEQLDTYFWKGASGIVIGGMGYTLNDKDEENHNLRAPKVNMLLQKPLADQNLIGVCLDMDDCFPSKDFTVITKKANHDLMKTEFSESFENLKEQGSIFSDCYNSAKNYDDRLNCATVFSTAMKFFLKKPVGGKNSIITFAGNSMKSHSLLSAQIYDDNKKLLAVDSFDIPVTLPQVFSNSDIEYLTTTNEITYDSTNDAFTISGYGDSFESNWAKHEENGKPAGEIFYFTKQTKK